MPYSPRERKGTFGIERECRRCEAWLPLTKFVRAKKCAGGYRSVCRMCHEADRPESSRKSGRGPATLVRRLSTRVARGLRRCNARKEAS
jgi:hypothetical protein